ncbi:retrovirus-related pol polyprotein from transposon TNT 1-94, partial [Tanacetum coccineum]
ERLVRIANPLALFAQQQPVYYPQPNPTHYTQSSSTRSQAATRNKGKAIANSPPPTYDLEPEVVVDDEASSKEKEIDKFMALISIQTGQYDNQRAVNVAGARENVGTQVVQQIRIQCFNCKEFRHVAREYDEPKDQELEAHYIYMAKIQEVILDVADNSGPIFDTEPFEKLIEIILFIVESGCTKHMMGNLKILIKFVEKFLGTVRFGNDQFAPILGYEDLVQGNFTIKRIRDLKGNDLLTGSRRTYLYLINLQETTSPNPICLMAKDSSSQAWLWHRRISHLNFDAINLLSKNDIVNGLPKLKFVKDHLCSFSELGKAKRKSFMTKTTPSSKGRLHLLHMDLCGPMRIESFNGKKYFLVIVDDYSRFTCTHFLRPKD